MIDEKLKRTMRARDRKTKLIEEDINLELNAIEEYEKLKQQDNQEHIQK